ncbi:MAG: hypothetical protein D6795_02290 [Deltaproteobacteria bacterium]|nr:MAG: hypothetical protein D6795_02290 [Deltaproteobacteria bacterium]
MSHHVDVILLCEDRQHAAFARRFLEKRGWNRKWMRVIISPGGSGSGEQFARENFPREIQQLRRRSASGMLVVMIDGDTSGPAARKRALDEACRKQGVEPRRADEAVAVFVPTWRIETWFAYLDGNNVNEEDRYPKKLPRQRACRSHVAKLVKMCEEQRLREPAPPSLQDACEEFNTRLLQRAKT